MKVYDPRLDTASGANPLDPKYHVETRNPALLFASYASEAGMGINWSFISRQANYCDELVPEPMTEARAREILGSILKADQLPTGFFSDPPEQNIDEDEIPKARLDGRFTADHLEAIAWWMRNKARPT